MLDRLNRFFQKKKTSSVKKKKLYLHVGMDKTGTSAIQAFLKKNRKVFLSENKLLYPETGMWNDFSHHKFAFSCIGMNGYSFDDFEVICTELVSEMEEAESVLISSECLFKLPTKEQWFTKFHQFIKDNFMEVKIIIYLRRQDEWVISRHKHSVISGEELSIETLSEPHFCDYKQYIDKWCEYFGKANIIVRPYERISFIGGNIFADFLNTLDINYSDIYVKPDHTINTALNNNEYSFKRLCNLVSLNGQSAAELNVILLKHSNISKFQHGNNLDLISDIEKSNLIHRYEDINRAIANEYLPNGVTELFQEVNFNIDDPKEKYTEIDNLDLREIKKFVYEKSPLLSDKLDKLCYEAMNSEFEEIKAAAHKLVG